MKKSKSGTVRNLAMGLAVFAAIFVGVYLLLGKVGTASGDAETEIVKDAVRSAVMTCYAVEGAYPTTLNYLKEHYGLAYNEDAYMVIYSAFATNVTPTIQVLERGGGGL